MAAARARGKKKKLRCCLAKGFEGEAHTLHTRSRVVSPTTTFTIEYTPPYLPPKPLTRALVHL